MHQTLLSLPMRETQHWSLPGLDLLPDQTALILARDEESSVSAQEPLVQVENEREFGPAVVEEIVGVGGSGGAEAGTGPGTVDVRTVGVGGVVPVEAPTSV
jgi:hypothetical protein